MKKLYLISIPFFIYSFILSNEIEKNKILNIMVDHNYDLRDKNHDEIDNYFYFPFSYNDDNETKT